MLNRHLKTAYNTRIYLEKMYWDERGIYFNLLYRQDEGLKPPYAVLTAGMISDDEGGGYSTLTLYTLREIKHLQKRDGFQNWRLPNVVFATNEKGEPAEYGSRGGGPGERIGMFLAREFVNSSHTIHVTIKKNLPYIRNWQGTIFCEQ